MFRAYGVCKSIMTILINILETGNMKNLNMKGLLFIILLSSIWQYTSPAQQKEYQINSPDEKIAVFFQLSENKNAYYRIEHTGTIVLQQSKLGIIREDGDFSKNLSLSSVSDVEKIQNSYDMLQGKRSRCYYEGNKRIFHLVNGSGNKIDVIFQVSNDGVAFRYYFPANSEEIKKIKDEVTSFNFIPTTKAWIQICTKAKTGWNHDQPSYEQNYQQDIELNKIPDNEPGWVFPALFKYNNYWILLTETAIDRNYCGCRLKRDSAGYEFSIGFPQKEEVFPGGPLNPQSTLPWYSPWRVITVGNSLKTIVESTLGTDLANPPRLQDTSFVKPGRASWSWIILKDNSVVYDVQKRFIDLASDMSWEYCLVDADWDTKIGYDKIKKLAEYGRAKNVGLLLWYNSAGTWNTVPYHPKSKLLTHQDRVKEFTLLKGMGIKGVKVDFFGGDGQSMMAYYQDIFEDAAQFGLMVNCHGCTLPRCWQRTYPNLVTMEAVKGFEFVTFEQANANLEANHSCVLPFTRNVFDPMDFTPVCFGEIPNIRRITTNAFELAVSVIFLSGIQHFALTPESMAQVPNYIKDFMKEIPVQWDDTCFIEGFPGKLVVLARKSGDRWYVAGINGEDKEKSISLELPFLEKTMSGILYTDGADKRSINMQEITVSPNETLEIELKANGGFVIKLDKAI